MRELPILFSTDMVKAILDGRKKVTRKVIKPQPVVIKRDKDDPHQGSVLYKVEASGRFKGKICGGTLTKKQFAKFASYQKGDLLYVRETFNDWDGYNYRNPKYKASEDNYSKTTWKPKWKPSIHMPKKYARIWLEVLNVRAERLQEISETDCWAEGIDSKEAGKLLYINKFGVGCASATFSKLWDSLNAKRGYPWEFNPWVWRYELKRIQEYPK